MMARKIQLLLQAPRPTPTQMAWSIIEKETYAVTYALSKYRNFVFAAKVIIFF